MTVQCVPIDPADLASVLFYAASRDPESGSVARAWQAFFVFNHAAANRALDVVAEIYGRDTAAALMQRVEFERQLAESRSTGANGVEYSA